MSHAFGKILRDGGVRGLWKGWVPNVQRAALVNLGGRPSSEHVSQIEGVFSHERQVFFFIMRDRVVSKISLFNMIVQLQCGFISHSLLNPHPLHLYSPQFRYEKSTF